MEIDEFLRIYKSNKDIPGAYGDAFGSNKSMGEPKHESERCHVNMEIDDFLRIYKSNKEIPGAYAGAFGSTKSMEEPKHASERFHGFRRKSRFF